MKRFCFLVFGLLLIGVRFSSANESAPAFLDEPNERVTRLCDSEKEQARKIYACNEAVMRYARMNLTKIPKAAEKQAQALLKLHQQDPKNDLFIFGLHDSYQTLGRLSLRRGRIKEANSFLAQSIQVPSTPPLQYIGPRMQLASELLSKGEKKAVLEYLHQVEKFWIGEGAKNNLAQWISEIESGKDSSLGLPDGYLRGQIQRTVRKHIKEVLPCYQDQQQKDLQPLEGKIVVDWTIDDKGRITKAQVNKESTSLQNERVQTCLVKKIKSWKFPEAPGGQTMTISFPFAFSERK